LQLAERGTLSLDDRVTQYLPFFTIAREVRVRHLLSQTSGIRDYNDALFLATVSSSVMPGRVDRDAVLRALSRWPLDFQPGTRFEYSNANYLVLGTIAERAAGMPLAALLRERIFAPLGMEDTALDATRDDNGADVATGYTRSPIGAIAAHRWDPQLTYAAGGVRSTALDLAAFDVGLISGRVVSPASFVLMSSGFPLPSGRSDYGFGTYVSTESGRQILWHDGTVLGFKAMNAVLPGTRDAVIVLADADYFHAADLAMQIAQGVFALPGGSRERFDPNLPRWSMSIGLALAAIVFGASMRLSKRRNAAGIAAVAVYAVASVSPPLGVGLACASLALVAWPARRRRA
jgi:CubicO group peptidase (beta-lactamase class C family)